MMYYEIAWWAYVNNFPCFFGFMTQGDIRKLGYWRRDRDSNPGDGFPPTHFPGVRLRPLGQLSSKGVYQLNRKNCNPIVFVFKASGFNYAFRIFDPNFSLCKRNFNSLFGKPFRNLVINFRFYRKHPINVSKNCPYFKI